MAKESGSSSPSTKPTKTICPMCGKGTLFRTTKDDEYEGVRVSDILVDECDACGECLWSPEETRRIRLIIETKLARKAA